MTEHIQVPIETNPVLLLEDSLDYLQQQIPGYEPSDPNLDYILLSIFAFMNAELRDVASDVPLSVFRYFGATVMQIPPQDAAPASAASTWVMIDNQGYTIPAGTLVSIPSAGDELVGFRVEEEVVVAPGATTTAAGEVTLVATEPGGESNGLLTGASLVDAYDFVASITLLSPTSGGVDAESDEEYLNRLTVELQLNSPRPIIPRDFEVLARRIPGVGRATAIDGFNPNNNLLTAQQSSVESGTTGFQADTNVNITQTATQAAHGAGSLQMSSIAAGDMAARTTSGTGGIPVTPGQLYTVRGESRVAAAGTPRQCRIGIVWYTAAGATISTTEGANAANSNAGWVERTHSAIAPPTAAFMALRPVVGATGGAGELHFWDKFQVREGISTTNWVLGPAPSINNERMITVVVVDEDGLSLTPDVKAAALAYLDSLREVNFLVNIEDPTYSTVDITYDVKALGAFDPNSIKANIDIELSDYLSPANWGLPPGGTEIEQWINQTAIRRLEVSTVINNVPGVDYINTLTIGINSGTQDTTEVKTLSGVAPLPTPGTLTGTVTS